MTVCIQSPDAQDQIDGTVNNNLLSHFRERAPLESADVVIIPISMYRNYEFNPILQRISKPIVIVDFMEYEWQWDAPDTHLFGKNTRECRWLGENWYPFDDWVRERNPVMYFKRELLKKDVSDRVKPIEWGCYLSSMPVQPKEEFDTRRLEVFFTWGYSHPCRATLHGRIFEGINTHGLGVISNYDQFYPHFQHEKTTRNWMSVHTPHFARRSIYELMNFQQQAKITVSLPGCGRKCFRSTEAPVASIMALHEDDMAWSHDWIDGENCIRLRKGHEFDDLDGATRLNDLYSIYVRSQETIDKYRGGAMVHQYMNPLIEAAL